MIYIELSSSTVDLDCIRSFSLVIECNQTQEYRKEKERRNNLIHIPLIGSATYKQEEVFNTNHWTEHIKQTPTRASSRGRCAYSMCTVRACSCLCVSAWLHFKTRVWGGLARPLAHMTALLRLPSAGAVVHMSAERDRLFRLRTFQHSLSAPDGRYSLLPPSSILPLPMCCSAGFIET